MHSDLQEVVLPSLLQVSREMLLCLLCSLNLYLKTVVRGHDFRSLGRVVFAHELCIVGFWKYAAFVLLAFLLAFIMCLPVGKWRERTSLGRLTTKPGWKDEWEKRRLASRIGGSDSEAISALGDRDDDNDGWDCLDSSSRESAGCRGPTTRSRMNSMFSAEVTMTFESRGAEDGRGHDETEMAHTKKGGYDTNIEVSRRESP